MRVRAQAFSMSLSDFIRTERRKKDWSQRDLAKKLGVSPGAVAQWELDQTRPAPMTMIDLCGVFGVQISAFFGPDGPYQGQFVDDPDELAWLSIWRRTPEPDRAPLLRALNPHAAKLDPPKRARKADNAA
jgi:transcriptional regulator with XRE-family HTH domain